MPSLPMTYINQGEYISALQWVMTNYVGFSIIWLMFAVVVFSLVYVKTESYGISGIIFTVFVSIIAPFLPPEIQMYFLLLIGAMLAVLAIKIYKG